MSGHIIPVTGGDSSGPSFGSLIGDPNTTDYVKQGLAFRNPDWANGTIEVTAGDVSVLLGERTATWTEYDASGERVEKSAPRYMVADVGHIDAHTAGGPNGPLDLTTAADGTAFATTGARELRVTADPDESDAPVLSVHGPGASAPPPGTIAIGTVDTAAETADDSVNRAPAGEYGTLDVHGLLTAAALTVSGEASIDTLDVPSALTAASGDVDDLASDVFAAREQWVPPAVPTREDLPDPSDARDGAEIFVMDEQRTYRFGGTN